METKLKKEFNFSLLSDDGKARRRTLEHLLNLEYRDRSPEYIAFLRNPAMLPSPALVFTLRALREQFPPADDEYSFLGKYRKCENCGKWHLKSEIKKAGEDDELEFCEDCASDFFQCDHCGKYHPILQDRNFDTICNNCEHLYEICDKCGSIELIEDLTEANERNYCVRCRDRLLTRCSSCGVWFDPEDGFSDEDSDEIYCCEDCAPTDRYIHDYGFKPYTGSYGTERRFGMEAEYLGESVNAKKFKDSCYCKHDGSLSDGFEVVTIPLLFDDMVNIAKYIGETAKACDMTGSNDECGIHLHVSKNGIKNYEETVCKMIYLLYNHSSKFSKFARRSSSRWAKYYPAELSDLDNKETMEALLIAASEDRYVALNLRNEKTVEFRIFKGTNNPKTMAAIVQFVNWFINYAEDVPFSKMREVSFADIVRGIDKDASYKEASSYLISKGLLRVS